MTLIPCNRYNIKKKDYDAYMQVPMSVLKKIGMDVTEESTVILGTVAWERMCKKLDEVGFKRLR